MKLILLILLVAVNSQACFQGDVSKLSIKWTAFKTPQKLGVSGKLVKIKSVGKSQAPTIEELIKNTKLLISTSRKSVSSNDVGRDVKISTFFFEGKDIIAQVVKLEKGIATFKINMMGAAREVPMKYEVKGMKFTASGYLDILDFPMAGQLKKLNQACFEKHEGKTWSDVKIEVEATLSKCKG